MAMWNPWRGCKRCSEGCLHCYIHKGDAKRGVNTNEIVKTDDFYKPAARLKNGNFKMKSGIVYMCFSTDFLIEEADEWRKECWEMIKQRSDCTFIFFTKRIDRLKDNLPDDWGDGYPNVVVGCSVENGKMADLRLPIFNSLPIKHRLIIAAPLLEKIDLLPYLNDGIAQVSVGGESGNEARVCDYDWVLDIKRQCDEKNVPFTFHQTGANFRKDGRIYRIERRFQHSQAKKAGIDTK